MLLCFGCAEAASAGSGAVRRKSRDREDPGVRKRTRMSRRREPESGNGAGSDGARRKSAPCRGDGPRKGGLRNQTEGLIPRDGCASAVRRWWRRRCGQESVEYAWKEDSRVSEGRQAGAENIGQGAEWGADAKKGGAFAFLRRRGRASGPDAPPRWARFSTGGRPGREALRRGNPSRVDVGAFGQSLTAAFLRMARLADITERVRSRFGRFFVFFSIISLVAHG